MGLDLNKLGVNSCVATLGNFFLAKQCIAQTMGNMRENNRKIDNKTHVRLMLKVTGRNWEAKMEIGDKDIKHR